MSPRRWYLLKAREAHHQQDHALESAWLAKQLEQPGTPLPATLPGREALLAAGYVALEDLRGAEAPELMTIGLTLREVTAVLAAIAT